MKEIKIKVTYVEAYQPDDYQDCEWLIEETLIGYFDSITDAKEAARKVVEATGKGYNRAYTYNGRGMIDEMYETDHEEGKSYYWINPTYMLELVD